MTVDKFMVFDVESIGLHGEGFAVAWVVVNRDGERLGEGCLSCDPAQCYGTDESRLWVGENVPPLERTSPTKQHLRNTFWHEWRPWSQPDRVGGPARHDPAECQACGERSAGSRPVLEWNCFL